MSKTPVVKKKLKIDGKVYTFYSKYIHKSDAQKRANKMREGGSSVRIITRDLFGTGNQYLIYYRK